MQLPQEVVRLRTQGDNDAPYWLAASDDGQSVVLEPGEMILQTVPARVTMIEPALNALGVMNVVVTDRRVAFVAQVASKNAQAFGGLSWAVAKAVDVAVDQNAKRTGKGKVLVGHVRFEWLAHVGSRTLPGEHAAMLTAPLANGIAAVCLHSPGWPSAETCQWLAQVAARDRLSFGTASEVGKRALEDLAAGRAKSTGVPGQPDWELGSEFELSITAAYQRLSKAPHPSSDV